MDRFVRFSWRRGRDLNPRYRFKPVYSLSSRLVLLFNYIEYMVFILNFSTFRALWRCATPYMLLTLKNTSDNQPTKASTSTSRLVLCGFFSVSIIILPLHSSMFAGNLKAFSTSVNDISSPTESIRLRSCSFSR